MNEFFENMYSYFIENPEMFMVLVCIILIIGSLYDNKKEKESEEKMNRIISFNENVEVKYYDLSDDERNMKRKHFRKLIYEINYQRMFDKYFMKEE